MQIRNFAAALVWLSILIGSQSAGAANNDAGADGCEILANAVYRSVSETGLGGWRSDAFTEYPEFSSPTTCDKTARAVSSGFTKAMHSMNLYVDWPTPEQQRGDVCLSHDLSQCYPAQHPYMSPLGLVDAAFVMNSWLSVQSTVLRSMPAGVAADLSRFDSGSINRYLQLRLQRAVHRQPGVR